MRWTRGLEAVPVAVGFVLLATLAHLWWGRLSYPFDLEWMEGGVLAHAWRLDQGLPLYVRPNPDFVPFIYPPGYHALVAALGKVFGLWMPLGRAVSIVSTVAAAAAIGFGLRSHGGTRGLSFASAVLFLGMYRHVGAFYDIVRPDGLAVALMAWAIVIGLEDRRGAPAAAGLLLAASFVVKHNMAAFGVPILLGLAWRDWRAAARFAVFSVVPALALTGYWQWRSEGIYLTYLLEVPRSHPVHWDLARIRAPRELGTALPAAFGLCGVFVVQRGMARVRSLPLWALAALPVAAGASFAWWGTYYPPAANAGVYNAPSSLAFWALAATPVAACLWGVGHAVDRWRGLGPALSWRAVYGLGVTATALSMALLMRAHHGGFVNVHIPALWCLCLGLGVVLSRWRAESAAPWVKVGVAMAITGQLLWSLVFLKPEGLRTTRQDVRVGYEFVRLAKEVDGPVLSPFSSWIPYYAGKPPSIHAMAVWDCNWPDGPFLDDLSTIRTALREQRWVLVLGGNQKFLGLFTDYYEPRQVVVQPKQPHLMPKAGWHARPWRTLEPIEAEW